MFVVRFRTGGRAVVSNQQYFDVVASFFSVETTKKSWRCFLVSSRACSLVWDDGSLLFTVDAGDGTINDSDSTSNQFISNDQIVLFDLPDIITVLLATVFGLE